MEEETQNKHRAYLKEHESKRFKVGATKSNIKRGKWWEDYRDCNYNPNINLIEIAGNELIIEFDEESKIEKSKKSTQEQRIKAIEETIANIEKDNIGYELFDHKGKCPHLEIRLNKNATKEEKEGIIKYYVPIDSWEFADTSLCGENHLIAVRYAKHWKYGTIKELVKNKEGLTINVENEKCKQIINNKNEVQVNYSSGVTADIVSKVVFTSVAESLGAKKEKRTKLLHCNFHDDKTPSLSIDDNTGLFNCFGCGRSGNIVDFVSEAEHIPISEAIKKLKEMAGISANKNNVEELEVISLKRVDAVPHKIIKTRILISDITPGVNITKGYKRTCSECGYEEVVFKKSKSAKCNNCDGKTIIEELLDTGYLCTAYDPLDSGSSPQFTNCFFSNKVIPIDKIEREEWETNIQTKKLIIEGEIVLLPSNKKIVEWVIDVKKYHFEEKDIHIDYDLLKKFDGIERDDVFFSKLFAPKTYKRNLAKKVYALILLSPYKIKLPNGSIEFGIPNDIEAGDPGQNKTGLAMEVLKYCKEGNSKLVSVENATNRGLIGAVVRNQSTGHWMIKMGQIPLCHKELCFLDGFGKLKQEDYAQLRNIMEEKHFQINKAGAAKKECAVRLIAISNLIDRVSNYLTKHKASYDISATTGDIANKFSGADRRRYEHVLIVADEDIDANEVDQHLYKKYDSKNENELVDYWNNLREFAWDLSEDKFVWEDGLNEYAQEKVNKLREKYKEFSLEYGMLSKSAMKMCLIQLPAVAILHNSFDAKYKIMVRKAHVDWLMNLYEEEFRDLGLDTEQGEREYFETHASIILKHASEDVINILALLFKYRSQSAIEKEGIMSRMTIFRKLNEIVNYGVKYEGDKESTFYHYSPNKGSLRMNYSGTYEETSELPPVCKRDGTITKFGKTLIKQAVTLATLGKHKKIVEVKDSVPGNTFATIDGMSNYDDLGAKND